MVLLDELRRSPLYSEELGIALGARSDREYFKWFLASVLFGGRISETIAKNTYRAFAKHRLLAARAILRKGWDYLVNPIMREGGYVRYDGRKSTQILRNCTMLVDEYGGSLKTLNQRSRNTTDLEKRILAFYGVGPTTMNIFLRELRPYWRKADPEPLPVVRELARQHGLRLSSLSRKTITFARIEAGLLRLRHARPLETS
jgi:hypothetical protein